MYWRKLQKKLTNYNIKEELDEIMRSISSAIISFVIFYIGLCSPKKERKQRMIRGCLFCLSFIMLIIAFTLMILGLWWNDDFKKGIINMTVKELKKKLIKGYRLKDLFDFSDGQDCIIYKSDFEITDDIIYIPDIDLNEINIDTKLNKEEIKNVLNSCYTGNDFVEECNGYKDVAEELFEFVDWQHPNIMDMLETYGENEFEEKYGFSIEELK